MGSHLHQALPDNSTGSSVTIPPTTTAVSSVAPFRPNTAIKVGLLTAIFSITVLVVLCAKLFKRRGSNAYLTSSRIPASSPHRHSGVDREVVDSLPVFRFAALRGHKDGLECSVCLNRFEPAEVLRLLPKCNHAFHVECVDKWFDTHSTCPLCRCRVDPVPKDVLLVQDPEPPVLEKPEESVVVEQNWHPPRFVERGRVWGRHSSAGEKSTDSVRNVIHRADTDESARRKSIDGTDCFDRVIRKDGLLLEEVAEWESVELRFGHRIIVSVGDDDNGGAQRRESDLLPSDLLLLKSEMIMTDSGR